MMPAKSTSDQRTYSSMVYGLTAIRSPRGVCSGEARRRAGEPPGRAGRPLLARAASVLRAQPVRLQPAPQRGPADAQPPGGFGEFAARPLQRVHDRLALSLRERAGLVG